MALTSTSVSPIEDGDGNSGRRSLSPLGVVLRFVNVAVDALAEAREEIDALNVYPVPDGDTGTTCT